MILYIVKSGDSVYSIARKFDVSPQKIINNNNIENDRRLMVGQVLIVAANNIRHKVTKGQTLYSIARNYGVPISRILKANPSIRDASNLKIGQMITIPVELEKMGSIDVNGYAFPTISSSTLANTLPSLTYLSIFSYPVKPDGSLVTIEEEPLIQTARRANVAPMMVITNIKEGGSFDTALAHAILSNPSVQGTLLDNIVKTLDEKQYFGLDIDFEYIDPSDRKNYNDFLKTVTERLHPLGYTVTTALAPKTSGNQTGLLYEAHDYAAQGKLADHVILMTYEWGYTYGPAQAVAPIDQVERVLQYAVSVIPSKKILMGMPNYGYDWTLPFLKGSAARTLSNAAAVSLAQKVGAKIEYDEKAQAPFFYYYDNKQTKHVVWFDDARSIAARLRLVKKYNLGGVSYWNINTFFAQNWLILNAMYDVNKLI